MTRPRFPLAVKVCLGLVSAAVAVTVLVASAREHRPQAPAAAWPGGAGDRAHDHGAAGHDHARPGAGTGAAPQAGTGTAADPADPCSAVIEAMGQEAPNRLRAAGLADDAVPVALLDRYRIGGMYCLADHMIGKQRAPGEGRVEAVMVDLLDPAGEIAALWLIARDDESSPARWEAYLRGYYTESLVHDGVPASRVPAPVGVERVGGSVVLVAAGPEAASVRAALTERSGPRLSLWEHVARQGT